VDAQTELVGMHKGDLYQCAGVPNRTATVDGRDYVTFDNSEITSEALTIPIIGGGVTGEQEQFCRITATIANGKVESISYTGDTGAFYATNEQCSYSVRTCVSEVEQRKKLQSTAAQAQ
jgi:hypothetical protein